VSVLGHPVKRVYDQRLRVPETPDLEEVDAEPKTVTAAQIDDDGQVRVTLNHLPVYRIRNVQIVRRVERQFIRYPTPSDPFPDEGVSGIESITQGGTTFVEGTDFELRENKVWWGNADGIPLGNSPASGSTYDIVYTFTDRLEPTDADFIGFDDASVTVAGVAAGSTLFVNYDFALPRHDAVMVTETGELIYEPGVPSRLRPIAPRSRVGLFRLAQVINLWGGRTPLVTNTDAQAVKVVEHIELQRRVETLEYQLTRSLMEHDGLARDPAARRGVQADGLFDDDIRDQGTPQTGAVFDQALHLPISAVVLERTIADAPIMLPAVEERILAQLLHTGSVKINEYQVLQRLPGTLTLDPAVDFWTETREEWASDVTRSITLGPAAFGNGGSTTAQTVTELDRTRVAAERMRVRDVQFEVGGFAPGERLETLLFDGVDVLPADELAADENGDIRGTLTIPEGRTAGTKVVRAEGAALTLEGERPSIAETTYTGTGVIDTRTMQRTFTVRTWLPAAPQQTLRDREDRGGDGADGPGGGGPDPLAQTTLLPAGRHLSRLRVKFTALGDLSNRVVWQVRETDDADYPSKAVLGEGTVAASDIILDQWTDIALNAPTWVDANNYFAQVLLTADGLHAVANAKRGELHTDPDTGAQIHVTQQPATFGAQFTSSINTAWRVHHDEDLTMELFGLRFTETTRTFQTGTWSLENCSDLMVRVPHEVPTAQTSVTVVMRRPNGETLRFPPDEPIQLGEYLTEDVEIDLELAGTATASPTVFPLVQVIAGTLAPEGDYVPRAIIAGEPSVADSRVVVRFEALLAGATSDVRVEVGPTIAGLVELGTIRTGGASRIDVLGDGWVAYEFEVSAYEPEIARARITVIGDPAARTRVRAISTYVAVDADQTDLI
ncbi:MAG: DUF4815 domain-containing protein, partial [Pseudomonadota bacterium]